VKKEYNFRAAKKRVQKTPRKDPRIESEWLEDVEITDPKTGKKQIHRVKVTRYKPAKDDRAKGIFEEEAEDLKRTLDTFNA
jgi:hypothetical protein